MRKIHIGKIHVDYLTMGEAVDHIADLVASRKGGFIVTPNVDHIVLAERDSGLQAAYADADLSLADGKPLLWISRLAGERLPEKVSGSDLVRPLLRRAEQDGLSVYFLGSAPGVGMKAAEILRAEMPALRIIGIDAPPKGFDLNPESENEAYARMNDAEPHIALMALGAPKQELLMHRWNGFGTKTVMLGIGASLDFIAGAVKRAPRWMSNMGLEWFYRLLQDPKRLIYRYLIRDLGIVPVVWRLMRTPKYERFSGSRGEGHDE